MNERVKGLFDVLTSHLLGAETAAELLITGLLADGHVLIQGGPGLGKTTLARTLAESLDCGFKRIQFTPDLLPADILGYNLFDQRSGEFLFHKGPIFSNMILADEINRASPRVQSALLEAMHERQVSVDGETYELQAPFFVVATQNHLSSAGTFPLPDSQLDRFTLSFTMPTPDAEVQLNILAFHAGDGPRQEVVPILQQQELNEMIEEVRTVHVAGSVMEYIVTLCAATTAHEAMTVPPSPRAQISIMNAARAQSYIHGRDAVYPDDVKKVMPYALRHRLRPKGVHERASHRMDQILREILDRTPVPVGGADSNV
jgi:MoxR-like ATPase